MTTMMTMMLIYCIMMMMMKCKSIKEKGLDSKRKKKSINHSQAKNVQCPPMWGDTLNILSPLFEANHRQFIDTHARITKFISFFLN